MSLTAISLTLLLSAAQPLTLDQALAHARQRNLELVQAKARVDQAGAQVITARAALFPVVTAQGRYTHNDQGASLSIPAIPGAPPREIVIQKQNQWEGGLSATVPLIVPSSWAQLASAHRAAKVSEATARATEADVLLSVAQAYYLAAGADEVVRAREDALVVAAKTLQDAQTRALAGTAQQVEVSRAQVASEQAGQRLREARAAKDSAYRALATLIEVRSDFSVVPPPLPSEPAPVSAEVASGRRPEVSALTLTVKAQEAARLADRLRWLPALSAFANARVFNYEGFTGKNHAWALGLELDWVLFDAGTRCGAAARSSAQVRESQAALEKLKESVADQLADARDQVELQRSAFQTAEHAVALSRDTLQLLRDQHDAGTASQLDLLQAQDALVAAEVSLAQARFDLGLAALRYARAAGTFPSEG